MHRDISAPRTTFKNSKKRGISTQVDKTSYKQLESLLRDFLKILTKFLKSEKTDLPKRKKSAKKTYKTVKLPIFPQTATVKPRPRSGASGSLKKASVVAFCPHAEQPLPASGIAREGQGKANPGLTNPSPAIGRRTSARATSRSILAAGPEKPATPGTTSSQDDTMLRPSAPNVDSVQKPTTNLKKVVGKILIPTSDGVMRRLLGPGGEYVKNIAAKSGAKLRIRGIGSGHLEGRARTECQVPLHLCISCPTQTGYDNAFRESQKLVERATKGRATPNAKPTMRKLRLAVVNEGKLSESASFFLSSWAKDNSVCVCLVSEGALPGRNLATDGGFCWAAPLAQRKGGAAFLLSPEASSWERKTKISQCPNRSWAIALWCTPAGTGIVSIYINPTDVQDAATRDTFLTRLSTITHAFPSCIIGGDFNSATGTAHRICLDRWAAENGFALVNTGVKTHFATEGHPGKDLDLLFARRVRVTPLEIADAVCKGHIRQIFEIDECSTAAAPRAATVKWKKLACLKTQEQFKESIKGNLEHLSLDGAVATAAETVLGRESTLPRKDLPTNVRRTVRKLRQNAKMHPRGSKEHREASLAIGNALRRHRRASWRKTLKKLATTRVIDPDNWKLLKHLQNVAPTAKTVGIPDSEIKASFSEIYSTNTVRRVDWDSAPSQEEINRGGQHDLFDAPFIAEEALAVLSSLPNRKAAGLDGIPHEAYKAISDDSELVGKICQDANAFLFGTTVPDLKARLVVIPKKGIPEDAKHMRPLMMLPTSRKILEKLIANRLNRLADKRGWDGMCPLQGGFRRGLSIERQLVFVQVAILHAKSTGESLRAVALDLVKAFDRVPKEFAAHCAAGYLKPLCPRLADLIVRLTLAPMDATVGNEEFPVLTGVAQGGILSPWLFTMVMNDLSLRLSGGGYSVKGIGLGTPLLADDVLLLDKNSAASEQRCQLAKEWVAEWGGEIHPNKTQWLDINSATSPTPFSIEISNPSRGRSIDYLGVTITTTGLKPKVGADEFLKTWKQLRCTMEVRGQPPGVALQVLRTLAYQKVNHGSAVTLPCAADLTNSWLRAAKQILCTYEQVHRVEVQRELGLLYHPIAWLCWNVIRFYGNALTTDRDPLLKQVLLETVASPDHKLRQAIEQSLIPSGVTWDELVTTPVADLKRKADARIRLWMRDQLIEEGKRLNLADFTNCCTWSDSPRAYLFEENGRYGFAFRLHSLGPADLEVGGCYFCGEPGGNKGSHVLYCNQGLGIRD